MIDSSMPFGEVLHMLDDLHRAKPDLVVSQWYLQATDNEIRALQREWKRTIKPF